MNIKGVKAGLKYLASSVLIYKQEDSNPVLKKAEEKLKSSMKSETATEEEIEYDYEIFDRVSDKWFKAFSNIEEAAQILFDEFAIFKNGGINIKWKKLLKTLDLLPSTQAKHLLVLGVKYHELGEYTNGNIKANISKNPAITQTVRILPQQTDGFSRRQHLLKKEESTLEEMYKVSTEMNILTLQSKKNSG